MANENTPITKIKKMEESKEIFDSVTPSDAMTILKNLARENPDLREKIETMVIALLGEVKIDEVAGEVFYELDRIQVEDLWDRSASTRDGYVDPSDESWAMVEESLEPFIEDQEKFQNLGQIQNAKKYGMGILQGIYQYAHETESEFKNWEPDAPLDQFIEILNSWKTSFPSEKDHADMKKFLDNKCPEWSREF